VLLLSMSDSMPDLSEELASVFQQYHFQSSTPGQMRIESEKPVNIGPLVRFLEEQGIQVTEARRYLPSLEDVFVQVTGVEAGLMMKEKEKVGGGGNQ
jgi:ABC-2 type transport system ATP-binding protein